MAPIVSICLPNLNNRRWLPERLETIFAQTFTNWELVVVDNFSDDGAWEFLRDQAAKDTRIRLAQAPREGMYANWNNCIRLARGDLIYIATSDDTMAPTFLEEMVAALTTHPECGIAQCCLEFIDQQSRPIPFRWTQVGAFQMLGEMYQRPHLRRAPLDGYLHCALETIYTSITQILIRRRVFETTSGFRDTWGSGGDFYWGMIAGFHHDVVHLPRFLATWRQHPDQASVDFGGWLATAERKYQMLKAALPAARVLPPHRAPSHRTLLLPAIRYYYQQQYMVAPSRQRFRVVLALMRREPVAALRLAEMKLRGTFGAFEASAYIRAHLKRSGLWQNIVPLD